MVLSSEQFNELVSEVTSALQANSQGVGEVEKVSSLSGIVSLPALLLSGSKEQVVEAPIELLSKPAVEAAAVVDKLTDDANDTLTSTNATNDIGKSYIEEYKKISSKASTLMEECSINAKLSGLGLLNMDSAIFNNYAHLSTLYKLISTVKCVVCDYEKSAAEAELNNKQLQNNILVSVKNSEEAKSIVLLCNSLVKEISDKLHECSAYINELLINKLQQQILFDKFSNSIEKNEEIRNTLYKIVLENIIRSGKIKEIIDNSDEITKSIVESLANCDKSTTYCKDATQQAIEAVEATNNRGFSPKIVDGVWYVWNDQTGEYVNTHISVSSDYVLTYENIKELIEANNCKVFTFENLNKLNSLTNYNDNEVRSLIQSLSDTINILLDNDDTEKVINSFHEIEEFLNGLTTDDSLTALLASLDKSLKDYVSKTYISEAPKNGKQYARENGKWNEIQIAGAKFENISGWTSQFIWSYSGNYDTVVPLTESLSDNDTIMINFEQYDDLSNNELLSYSTSIIVNVSHLNIKYSSHGDIMGYNCFVLLTTLNDDGTYDYKPTPLAASLKDGVLIVKGSDTFDPIYVNSIYKLK